MAGGPDLGSAGLARKRSSHQAAMPVMTAPRGDQYS